MIVCLGWGSLIWRRETLPVVEPWHDDGPNLPVEFGRQSRGGQITLIIRDGQPVSRVLWAKLEIADLAGARESLRAREKIPSSDAEQSIAHWSRCVGASGRRETFAIAAWAAGKPEIESVVWTALPPKFDGEIGRMPTEKEVITYLRELKDKKLDDAREYVRRAPAQIQTPYRKAIEEALGWMPVSSGGAQSA